MVSPRALAGLLPGASHRRFAQGFLLTQVEIDPMARTKRTARGVGSVLGGFRGFGGSSLLHCWSGLCTSEAHGLREVSMKPIFGELGRDNERGPQMKNKELACLCRSVRRSKTLTFFFFFFLSISSHPTVEVSRLCLAHHFLRGLP